MQPIFYVDKYLIESAKHTVNVEVVYNTNVFLISVYHVCSNSTFCL